MSRLTQLSTLGLVAVTAVACSNARNGGGGSASDVVVAVEGGTVAANANQIEIPANALSEDTEVSLIVDSITSFPALEGAQNTVLRIEPEGQVLEVPATVTIAAGLASDVAAERVTVSQLYNVDGVMSWRQIETAISVVGGNVTASVSRFAPLAVVVASAVVTPGGNAIEGTVAWGDGSPVDSAPVELWQGESKLTETTTDAEGGFGFADLTAGTYSVRIDYECMVTEAVEVTASAPTQVTITLCGG